MSLSNSASFIEPHHDDSDDDVHSLPSDSDSSSGSEADNDEYISDAEREWRESLQQLELMLTMILIPVAGKYFGRKAAYWGKWDSLFLLQDSCCWSSDMGWFELYLKHLD